jgi:hypothetical protein
VLTALEELGVEVLRVTGDEALAKCPAHLERTGKEDNHPSFSVNVEEGVSNCLAGETRVITYEGAKEIRDLAGSSHRLLTSSGWVIAPVKSFGEQRLWDVVVRRNGIRKTIRATEGHRWFVRGMVNKKYYYLSERTTATLIPGHRLKSVRPHRSGTLAPSPWGVAHGITFGDGSRDYAGRSSVALWGEKDAALLKFFPLSPTLVAHSAAGFPGILVMGLPAFFKDLPATSEASSYLYGWLAGYFAADGCVDEAGMPTMASANLGNLEFIRDLAHRLGIVTYGIRTQMRSGFGDEESALHSISFSRSSLNESFFLIDVHRERWLAHRDVKERLGWVVESVMPTDVIEEVFCAEVPGVHEFALEDNLVTGNCFSCGFRGPFVLLVEHMLKCDRDDAVGWIRARGGIERVKRTLDESKGLRLLTRDTTLQINEASLALFVDPPAEALAKRGLSLASVQHYGILWDAAKDRWITPIRDPNTGKLWGWQAKNERYFSNFPKQVTKSQTLFGLEQFVEGPAIVIESPLDVPRIFTAGVEGGLSSYGAGVSEAQMKIVQAITDECIVGLDNDKDGTTYSRWLNDTYGKSMILRFLNYADFDEEIKDPGNMTDDQILHSIDTAISSTLVRF